MGACSTTFPAYMTTISSVRLATTPRSWVTRIIAMCALALQVGQQVEDLGLHGDVEAGGRLVGQEQPGRAGQGDGDHDPLAHAARQLERVPSERSPGEGMPTGMQERERGLVGLGLGPASGGGGATR